MNLRFKFVFWLFFVWLAVAKRQTAAEDWPLVRGDVLGSGVARTALPDDLEVLWKYPAGKDAGFDATPVIANGVVYIGDSAGVFHAVRLSDGSKVWSKTFDDSGFAAGAAFEKNFLYVGDVNGIIRCLAVGDGKEVWNQKLEGEVYAGPTPIDDYVLFTSEAGTLTWLRKNDGKPLKTFHIEAPLRCTPTIVSNRIVLAGCDSKLHLIDVESAKEIDSIKIDAPTGATAAMHNARAYFGTEGGTFFAINIPADRDKKASIAWSFRDPQRNQPMRASAAVNDQFVAFGSQSKAIYLLEMATGKQKWKFPTRTRVESGTIIVGDRVVAATAMGKIYLLDAQANKVKWEHDAGGGFTGSPAVVDQRIVIGNTDGSLYCFGSKASIEKNEE